MIPAEYLSELKNRYKTYTHLKLQLQNCTKNEFDVLCNDLLDEIFSDEKRHNEFTKVSSGVSVIEKEYADLCRYSFNVLNFFNVYKQIKGF